MRRVFKLLLITMVILSVQVYAKDQIITKSPHMLFELDAGAAEGTFMKKRIKGDGINLYTAPDKKATIFKKVLFDMKTMNPAADFYKPFDQKIAPAYFDGIYSKETKNGFYKVYYKGDYYWVHGDEFYKVTRIDDFLKDGFSVHKKFKLYSVPNGAYENVELKDDHSSNTRYFETEKVIKMKWIDNRLWIKVKIHYESCSNKFYFKKPVIGWMTPFDENNKPLYGYGPC